MQARLVDWVEADPVHGALLVRVGDRVRVRARVRVGARVRVRARVRVDGAGLAALTGAVVAAHHAARELGLVRCRGKVRGRVRVSVRQGYKG